MLSSAAVMLMINACICILIGGPVGCLDVLFLMPCPDVLSSIFVNRAVWMQDKFQTYSDNKVLSNHIVLSYHRIIRTA